MSSVSVANSVRPRHQVEPPAVTNAGQEALELAASAGLILDPWQADVLRASLGETADRKWAALEVGLIVPRQNGKGSVLEARELAGLFLFGDELILHSAHEFKTASEAFRRIKKLIEQTPDLDRQVLKMLSSNSYTGIELRNGSRLAFVARTKGGGRGFSGDLVILDEAYNLPRQMVAAMLPTLSARRNPQVWYTSSAPIDREPASEVLRTVCRRGRNGGPGRLAYIEFCAAHIGEPLDLEDDEALAQANPSLGVWREDGSAVSVEFVREVERPTLTDEDFARERYGVWDDRILEANERIYPADDWAACLDDRKWTPQGDVAFAVDVHGGSTSIAISDGTHVEVVEYRKRISWVVARIKELVARWKPVVVVLDPKSDAAPLIDDFTTAGIELHQVSGAEYVQACGSFLEAVIDHRVRHMGQVQLELAIVGAAKRQYGDSWTLSRRLSTSDISPLVAVTLARWAVNHGDEEDGPSVYEDRGMVGL